VALFFGGAARAAGAKSRAGRNHAPGAWRPHARRRRRHNTLKRGRARPQAARPALCNRHLQQQQRPTVMSSRNRAIPAQDACRKPTAALAQRAAAAAARAARAWTPCVRGAHTLLRCSSSGQWGPTRGSWANAPFRWRGPRQPTMGARTQLAQQAPAGPQNTNQSGERDCVSIAELNFVGCPRARRSRASAERFGLLVTIQSAAQRAGADIAAPEALTAHT